VRLPPHAHTLEHAGRRGVPGIDLPEDPVGLELAKSKIDDGPGRFGRQPLTLGVGMEDVADLRLAVRGTDVVEHQVADGRPTLGPLHGQIQNVAFSLNTRAAQLLRE